MKTPSPTPHCSFCLRNLADVELLFRGQRGGEPPYICGACLEERMAWIMMDRANPGFLAGVIAIQKAKIAECWAEAHPNSEHSPL